MGTNTDGKLQVFGLVEAPNPNAGQKSYRDAVQAEFKQALLDFEIASDDILAGDVNKFLGAPQIRDHAISSYVASSVPAKIESDDSASIVIDMNTNIASLDAENGTKQGDKLVIYFRQDGTGGRSCGFSSIFLGGLNQAIPTLNGAENSIDIVGCLWDVVKSKWLVVGHQERYL